jgi:hypothetical protein
MASIVAGVVTVADDGSVSYAPAGAENSLAGCYYQSEIETVDTFTVANGGEVLPDAQRVELLRYYALLATNRAARVATYLNFIL